MPRDRPATGIQPAAVAKLKIHSHSQEVITKTDQAICIQPPAFMITPNAKLTIHSHSQEVITK